MKHLIEIPLANGETVIVEVDGAETSAQPFPPLRGVREVVEEQIVERCMLRTIVNAKSGPS